MTGEFKVKWLKTSEIIGDPTLPPVADYQAASESECAAHLLRYVFEPLLDQDSKNSDARLERDALFVLLGDQHPAQLALRNQQLRVKTLIAVMGSQSPSSMLAAVNQLKRQIVSTSHSPMRPVIGLLDAYLSLRCFEVARARRALLRAVESADTLGLVEIAVVLRILLVRLDSVLGASFSPCFNARTFAPLIACGRSERMQLAAKLLLDQCVTSLCVYLCRTFKHTPARASVPSLLPGSSLHHAQAQALLDDPSVVTQLMPAAELCNHPIRALLALRCDVGCGAPIESDQGADANSAAVNRMTGVTLALHALSSRGATRDQLEGMLAWQVQEGASSPELNEVLWIAGTTLNRKDLSWALLKALSGHAKVSKRARLRYASQFQSAHREQRPAAKIFQGPATARDASSDVLSLVRIRLTRAERNFVHTFVSGGQMARLLPRLSLHPL